MQKGLSYDIQGPRDQGSDIIVRLGEAEESAYFCFQVKAHDELGAKDVIKTLRHQLSQSEDAYQPLVKYYILLFAEEGVRREVIRLIQGEFVKKIHVIVVEPSYLHTFMTLPGMKTDAYIRSVIGEEDFVYRQALQDVSDWTPSQAILAFALLVADIERAEAWTFAELASWPFLQEAYSFLPDLRDEEYFRDDPNSEEGYENQSNALARKPLERLTDDLDALEANVVTVDEKVRADAASSPYIMAVLTDARARFGYEGQDLVEHALALFGYDEQWDLPLTRPESGH